ncbi:MAG: hypothetical protein ACLQJL_08845 [Roseiarcus sp.]
MGKPRARRRAPRIQTERGEARSACAAHLRDLKRAHGAPPPDVAVPQTSVPARPAPEPASSSCASPAQLCAELVR